MTHSFPTRRSSDPIPQQPGKLISGGKLQALAIKGQKSVDTRNWEETTIQPGHPLDAEWIDLENVDSPKDDLHVRGFEQGAARFARGEGMWYGNKEVYFACTNGGKEKQGQVFRYIPASGKLELFAEPNDKKMLRHCANITVAPWGAIILSEDNESPRIVREKQRRVRKE